MNAYVVAKAVGCITLLSPLSAFAQPAAEAPSAGLPPPSPELVEAKPTTPPPPSFHPIVTLRDAEGTPVFESNQPVSSLKTCDGCHEVAFIESHSYHSSLGMEERTALGRSPSGRPWDFGPGLYGRWDPITYSVLPPPGRSQDEKALAEWIRTAGGRHVGGGPIKDKIAQDCLLCHTREASTRDRARALAEGKLDKASMATLAATGLVVADSVGGSWDKDRFLPDGRVTGEMLGLGRPTNRTCGGCHALVPLGKGPVRLAGLSMADRERLRMTETQGMVFSGQRISDSAVNVVGKEQLTRPWDVHAQRMVSCIGCHFSPNSPSYIFDGRSKSAIHLLYDARHDAIGNYLRTPDHNLAKGYSVQGTVADQMDGRMRDCRDCHDVGSQHRFLPRPELHFQAMRCESCHIPKVTAPARSETDYTMLVAPGEPRVAYRGIQGDIQDPQALIDGFVPVLLPGKSSSGNLQLVPSNLIVTWFWIEEGPTGARPVPKETLNQAFFSNNTHQPEVIRVLDRNQDGKLTGDEFVLDTEAKVAAVRERLAAAGARNPRIQGEIQPYSLGHSIVSGRFVTRECASCHSEDSRVARTFVLSARAPAGVTPTLVGDSSVNLAGSLVRAPSGALLYQASAISLVAYIPGAGQYRTIDAFGLLLFLGTVLGVTGHALIRVYMGRRRKAKAAFLRKEGKHE